MNRKPVVALACLVVAAACSAAPARAGGLPKNWPLPPAELERRFATEEFTILEVKGAGAGVTGASRLKVRYGDGTEFKLKWKAVPGRSADGSNNSPRKELAAYEIQKLFLDPDDYVVPTSAPYCIPLEQYKALASHPTPSEPGSRCVLGVVSVWLDDVTAPDEFWDRTRFATDPVYASSMEDFNLLTYLIDHRDGRQGNLLVSTVPGDARVFAVDNGISFGPFPWNFFVPNWNRMRVPALRKETVDRLRKVTGADLERLGVVAEVALDDRGIYRRVEPGPNLGPRKGVRIVGSRVQAGLTRDEIEDVQERVEDVLKDVDKGKLPLR